MSSHDFKVKPDGLLGWLSPATLSCRHKLGELFLIEIEVMSCKWQSEGCKGFEVWERDYNGRPWTINWVWRK